MAKQEDIFKNLEWFVEYMTMPKMGRVKKEHTEYWWKAMVQMNENIVGLTHLDASKSWKAGRF
jgi:hypothetical protein